MDRVLVTRRRVVQATLAGLGLALGHRARAGWAAGLLLTPRQSRGPFYPSELPLDRDNDLTRIAGRAGQARGEISDVVGRVLDERGRALAGARVEIWQCDVNGRYRHPWDRRDVPLDPDFQGYGQTVSSADGAYRFRTIKPVSYPGRAPHIHFAVSGRGFEPLITQLYVAGAPENERDGLLGGLADQARRQLIVPFAATPGGGPLVATFDIVLAADGRLSGPTREYALLRR